MADPMIFLVAIVSAMGLAMLGAILIAGCAAASHADQISDRDGRSLHLVEFPVRSAPSQAGSADRAASGRRVRLSAPSSGLIFSTAEPVAARIENVKVVPSGRSSRPVSPEAAAPG